MRLLPTLAIVLWTAVSACGGGPDAPPVVERHTLAWTPPVQYSDNTPLPASDLCEWWIYASDNGAFTDNDLCAVIAAWENGAPVENFDLLLLAVHGIVPPRWMSLRTVVRDNNASGFAAPVLWEG